MGLKLIEMLQIPMTYDEISKGLAEEYDLPIHLIKESLEAFFIGALRVGFIREVDDESRLPEIFAPFGGDGDRLSKNPLTTIWLHVTNACPLECYYCARESDPHVDRTDELTLEEIVNLYENLPEGPLYKTVITGGEPFLRADVPEIVKTAKKHGITMLTTNGLVNDKSRLLDALEYLDAIQISVDGPTAELHDKMRGKGSFEAAMSTMAALKDSGYKNYWLSTTATHDNFKHLSEMLKFAYIHGACGLYVGRLMPSGRSRNNNNIFPEEAEIEKELEKLWSAYGTLVEFHKNSQKFNFILEIARSKVYRTVFNAKYATCGLGGNGTISVAHNGDVYPCHQLHVDEFKIGNVRKEPLHKLLQKASAHYSSYTVDHLPRCKDCSIRYMCRGGCLALTYFLTGNLKNENPECSRNYHNITTWCSTVVPRMYRPRYLRKKILASETEPQQDTEAVECCNL
jgi:radical SAM protein with 4Fe4S-binding SPASM domain